MYTEEEFEELATSEDGITEEALIAMILLLRSMHSDLEKELTDFYNKYGKDGVVTCAEANKWVSEKNHSHRLTALVFAINFAFANTHTPVRKQFESLVGDIIEKERVFFNTEFEDEKLRYYRWGADNLTWEDRLNNHFKLWAATVVVNVKQSIMKQDKLPVLLGQIDKRFRSMESVIKTLGMTEVTALTSATRKTVYKALGYNKYRYYTKADERTCETCGEMHGKTFPLSALEVGVNAPSMHPRCRCWIEPFAE